MKTKALASMGQILVAALPRWFTASRRRAHAGIELQQLYEGPRDRSTGHSSLSNGIVPWVPRGVAKSTGDRANVAASLREAIELGQDFRTLSGKGRRRNNCRM